MSRRNAGLALALAALAGLCLLPLAAVGYDYSYARVVRLSLVEGDVQVARPDQQGWEQAVVNLPIQQGFSIATGGGRAEIEFESGATARLAENSVLQFTELALSDGARVTKLTLTQGTATFYANLARQDSFVVVTPQLQVVIPENARFRLDVIDDATSVSVLKGEVEVDSQAGTNRVVKGHALTYRSSDPDRVTLERNAKPDAWDRWVADRDEVIHSGDSAALRYVNTPYSYGLSDLYNYGGWYNLGGYGWCWRPYGVGLNWAPYSYGRWAFFPGLGWTWVAFERWGWLPYHFGSWIFSPNVGWLWVPGAFNQWQPALVTWVRVGNRTGWVPLAPQDRPGQTPTNLQHGFVSLAPNQVVGTNMHLRVQANASQPAQVLPGPPAGFVAATTPTMTIRSGPPAAAPSGGNTNPRGIVFDPRTRTFVNNPARPVHSDSKVGDARIQQEVTPAPRGWSGAAPAKQPNASRQTSPPPAPPQTMTPRTAPSPPSPPPPVVAPRPTPAPSSPPPRTERPPARSQSFQPATRWESAPRPSSPPAMPRSEPRPPPAGSRPNNR